MYERVNTSKYDLREILAQAIRDIVYAREAFDFDAMDVHMDRAMVLIGERYAPDSPELPDYEGEAAAAGVEFDHVPYHGWQWRRAGGEWHGWHHSRYGAAAAACRASATDSCDAEPHAAEPTPATDRVRLPAPSPEPKRLPAPKRTRQSGPQRATPRTPATGKRKRRRRDDPLDTRTAAECWLNGGPYPHSLGKTPAARAKQCRGEYRRALVTFADGLVFRAGVFAEAFDDAAKADCIRQARNARMDYQFGKLEDCLIPLGRAVHDARNREELRERQRQLSDTLDVLEWRWARVPGHGWRRTRALVIPDVHDVRECTFEECRAAYDPDPRARPLATLEELALFRRLANNADLAEAA